MDDRLPLDQRNADEASDDAGGRGTREVEDAFRRLVLLDLPGARASFEGILHDTLAVAADTSLASYLLYDILSRVERVVSEHQGLPARQSLERLPTVRRFATARTRDDLVWAFWSAYEAATSLLGALTPPAHPSVEAVKTYVRENYTRRVSLTEIAGAVGVSRNYLSHLFRRFCGMTVTEFVHRVRMREAERLLLAGKKTVSEIAYLVGYQNYRDFHRNFVRYQKTSPKIFRQVRAAARRSLEVIPP